MANFIVKHKINHRETLPRNVKFQGSGMYHYSDSFNIELRGFAYRYYINYHESILTDIKHHNQPIDYDGYWMFDDHTGVFDACDEDGVLLPQGVPQQMFLYGINPKDYDAWKKEYVAPLTPKCTCGIMKTMGNVDISLHSDYCDLKEKK